MKDSLAFLNSSQIGQHLLQPQEGAFWLCHTEGLGRQGGRKGREKSGLAQAVSFLRDSRPRGQTAHWCCSGTWGPAGGYILGEADGNRLGMKFWLNPAQ